MSTSLIVSVPLAVSEAASSSVTAPVVTPAIEATSLVFVTVILNVSLIAALPLSVAVTLTSIAPTFALSGVPLNVRVSASNESQDGSALSSDSVAV